MVSLDCHFISCLPLERVKSKEEVNNENDNDDEIVLAVRVSFPKGCVHFVDSIQIHIYILESVQYILFSPYQVRVSRSCTKRGIDYGYDLLVHIADKTM